MAWCPAIVLALTVAAGPSPSAGFCSQETEARYPGGYPKRLDVGIYWYGEGNDAEKAEANKPSKYYDPKKKTVIFFHGWMGAKEGEHTKVELCDRPTTRCSSILPGLCPDDDLLLDRWLADWNVGFFYWDQFADEECARDAEQKVWFDVGNEGLRWKSYDPDANTYFYPHLTDKRLTVGDLCFQAISSAMANFKGPNVRFVGHGIGAQLAVRCAEMLHLKKHPASPRRMALLEPYFTEIHASIFRCNKVDLHPKVGDRLASATASSVKNLWDKYRVPTEVYKSSALTTTEYYGNPNEQLEGLSVVVTYQPEWCGGLGPINSQFFGQFGHLDCKTSAVIPTYFLQYSHEPPTMTNGEAILASCPTPSSTCTDMELRELVNRQRLVAGQQHWKQEAGMNTFDLRDDTFALAGPSASQEGAILETTTTTMTTTVSRTRSASGQAPVAPLPGAEGAPEPDESSGSASSRIVSLGFVVILITACLSVAYCKSSRGARSLRYSSMENSEDSGSDEEYSEDSVE